MSQFIIAMNNITSTINAGLISLHKQRVDQIANQFKVPQAEVDLEKGVIDTLNSSNLAVSKSGTEIKDKLIGLIEKAINEKELLEIQLNNLQQQIGIVPDEESYRSYEFKQLGIFSPYKRYSHKCCYQELSPREAVSVTYLQDEQKQSDTQKNELCHSYNNALDQYSECLMNEVALETMINNLNENQSYLLTLTQLKTLGF